MNRRKRISQIIPTTLNGSPISQTAELLVIITQLEKRVARLEGDADETIVVVDKQESLKPKLQALRQRLKPNR